MQVSEGALPPKHATILGHLLTLRNLGVLPHSKVEELYGLGTSTGARKWIEPACGMVASGWLLSFMQHMFDSPVGLCSLHCMLLPAAGSTAYAAGLAAGVKWDDKHQWFIFNGNSDM